MFDHRRSRRSSHRATYFAPQVTSGMMPKIKLTKGAIDALEPGPKDLMVWDLSLSGFGVKVTPTGRKVFIALYRTRGGRSRLRKYTIGPFGRVHTSSRPCCGSTGVCGAIGRARSCGREAGTATPAGGGSGR